VRRVCDFALTWDDDEKWLAVLDEGTILDQQRMDPTRNRGRDRIEHLHHLDEPERRPYLDDGAGDDERW
jgi:hypothetical protein